LTIVGEFAYGQDTDATREKPKGYINSCLKSKYVTKYVTGKCLKIQGKNTLVTQNTGLHPFWKKEILKSLKNSA
jgi:hypothetical protein